MEGVLRAPPSSSCGGVVAIGQLVPSVPPGAFGPPPVPIEFLDFWISFFRFSGLWCVVVVFGDGGVWKVVPGSWQHSHRSSSSLE